MLSSCSVPYGFFTHNVLGLPAIMLFYSHCSLCMGSSLSTAPGVTPVKREGIETASHSHSRALAFTDAADRISALSWGTAGLP